MTQALPVALICHSMPGRTRLRIEERRNDTAFFASLASRASTLPGVLGVDIRPLTGSVLVRHLGSIANLRSTAADAGLFIISGLETESEPPSASAFDPKLLAAFALTGLALWQISRERVFPPALTLLWYASNLGGTWGKDGPWEGQ